MSYIEKHLLFSVNGYEEPWKIQFYNPFNGEDKKAVVAYVLAPNSRNITSQYNGSPVLTPGPLLTKVMKELIPRIQSYPYEWEWSGKKIYQYGFDFITDMSSIDSIPTTIELTDIAYHVIAEFYELDKETSQTTIVNSDDKITVNGVAVKLQIELQRAQWINQLSLDYFSDFPMKLVSLIYQKDTNPYSTIYEIPLDSIIVNRQTECILFPKAFMKRVFLIVQQEHYTPIVHVPMYQTETVETTVLTERTYETSWTEVVPEEYTYQPVPVNPTPSPVTPTKEIEGNYYDENGPNYIPGPVYAPEPSPMYTWEAGPRTPGYSQWD
jgi:hypothetical protein